MDCNLRCRVPFLSVDILYPYIICIMYIRKNPYKITKIRPNQVKREISSCCPLNPSSITAYLPLYCLCTVNDRKRRSSIKIIALRVAMTTTLCTECAYNDYGVAVRFTHVSSIFFIADKNILYTKFRHNSIAALSFYD